MEVLLIRHGKTKGNLESRYVGRTDEPILQNSIEELSEKDYGGFRPDLVYSSRMLRCVQTAESIFSDEKICIWNGFEETDFGEFEYKNYEELNGHPAYQAWIDSGGRLKFPGGESGVDFRKRCCAAFLSCIKDAKEKNAEKMAVVVHGGTIMSIMEAFGKPRKDFYDWQPKNGGGFLTKLCDTEEGICLQLLDII